VAAGLLVPGVLLSQPVAPPAQGKEPRAVQKRTMPREAAAARTPAASRTLVTAKKKRTATASAPRRRVESCVHIVQRGESVSRIASRHRVTRQSLIAANRVTAPDALRAGQRLTIPGCRPGPPTDAGPALAVQIDDGLLLARVGPSRVPTRLFVAVPEFSGEAVEFIWPVDGALASAFGRRQRGWHAGIDIMAEGGTPVVAAAAGIVQFSGWAGSYGRLIKIQHPNGFVTIYAHNHEILVQAGDEVEAGTVIATVGRTGKASAEHLHFEIRRDGMAYNPLHLLDPRDGPPVLASAPGEPLDQSAEPGEPLDQSEEDGAP
jgi:LysM repeat protein